MIDQAWLEQVTKGLDTSLDHLTPDTKTWIHKVIDQCAQQGLELRVRSTLRSCAEQHQLYLIGRVPVVDPKIQVTKADGCISWHVLGRAIDFDVMDPATGKPTWHKEPYTILGTVAKELGGKWGGDFPGFWDGGHVEYHPGQTIAEACPDPSACEASQAKALNAPPGPGPDGDGGATDTGSSWTPAGKLVVGTVVAATAFTVAYQIAKRARRR